MIKIGELSRRTGFSVRTLRYYDEVGLIRPLRRSDYGHRRYGEDAVDMSALIRSARSAGLSPGQIKKILRAARRGSACNEMIPLLNEKIAEIDRAIRTLTKLRTRLRNVLQTGVRKQVGDHGCPILEGLAETACK